MLGAHLPGCRYEDTNLAFAKSDVTALREPANRRIGWTKPIRVWARTQGYIVADSGGVPEAVMDAYARRESVAS
jgi:hypothetical protein